MRTGGIAIVESAFTSCVLRRRSLFVVSDETLVQTKDICCDFNRTSVRRFVSQCFESCWHLKRLEKSLIARITRPFISIEDNGTWIDAFYLSTRLQMHISRLLCAAHLHLPCSSSITYRKAFHQFPSESFINYPIFTMSGIIRKKDFNINPSVIIINPQVARAMLAFVHLAPSCLSLFMVPHNKWIPHVYSIFSFLLDIQEWPQHNSIWNGNCGWNATSATMYVCTRKRITAEKKLLRWKVEETTRENSAHKKT